MAATGTANVTGILVTDSAPTEFYNEDGDPHVVLHNRVGVVFVKLGKNVSTTDYSFRLNTNATLGISDYIGPVSVVMESGAGYIDITTWG